MKLLVDEEMAARIVVAAVKLHQVQLGVQLDIKFDGLYSQLGHWAKVLIALDVILINIDRSLPIHFGQFEIELFRRLLDVSQNELPFVCALRKKIGKNRQ